MAQPNLFSYATSELSQDAFLCWMLAWAPPAMAEVDGELHQLGQSFVSALFSVAGIDRPDGPSSITIHRQLGNVDVLVFVGDSHIVLIEDKVDSKQHSDQLRRYPKVIGEKYPHLTQVRVYVTTGDQDDLHNVRGAGWAVMRRIDLLKLLRAVRSENAILVDFRDHLERIERAVGSFRTKPPGSWGRCDDAWKGFFATIQERLGTGGWHYVNNPSGGFFGFWWGGIPVDGGDVYLELHEGTLLAKVSVQQKERRRQLRDLWQSRLTVGKWKRPKRLGRGKTMTVAEYGDYRIWRDGVLDVDATVNLLQAATEEVHEVLVRHR